MISGIVMNCKMGNEHQKWLIRDSDGDANELHANGRTSVLITTLPRIRSSTLQNMWTVSKML